MITTVPIPKGQMVRRSRYLEIKNQLRAAGYDSAVQVSIQEFPGLLNSSPIGSVFQRAFPLDIIRSVISTDKTTRTIWREKRQNGTGQ